MFRLHKEGQQMLITSGALLSIACYAAYYYLPIWAFIIIAALSAIVMIFSLQFFRNPVRTIAEFNDSMVYAPADGKLVVMEETMETEYFNEKRLQLSIFMSPLNVHVNRNPISGKVEYYQYHPGKYLVAWHPKSSTENERTTVVLNNGKHEILFRQIAGAMARRIVSYLSTGMDVKQGEDMGFIKFGSRVDLYLPLDAEIKVNIGDVIKGNKTVLAVLPS